MRPRQRISPPERTLWELGILRSTVVVNSVVNDQRDENYCHPHADQHRTPELCPVLSGRPKNPDKCTSGANTHPRHAGSSQIFLERRPCVHVRFTLLLTAGSAQSGKLSLAPSSACAARYLPSRLAAVPASNLHSSCKLITHERTRDFFLDAKKLLPNMARNGHDAMSTLSPLSGADFRKTLFC
jgi:hypothetical protein